MARIYPFRALRYNPSLVRVEDCVTQPYDKISPAMQQRYYAASEFNLVRIILGLAWPTDVPGENDVYTRAAAHFNAWREEGVLAADAEPSLYAYSQRFSVPGTGEIKERQGVLCLGAISPYEDGIIHRHEQTHTRARTDRMQLLKATRAHFGQIFMLYSDPAHTVESLLFEANRTMPEIEVEDEYGTLHRVWKISDRQAINMVQSALDDKKLIIADGHHRYETAMAYAAEHNALGLHSDGMEAPPKPESAVLMTLVNMDSDGLVVLPTHRIVHGLQTFSAKSFTEAAEIAGFTVTALTTAHANEHMQALQNATTAAPDATEMIAVTREGAWRLSLSPEKRAAAMPALLPRRRDIDLVVLHDLVLNSLLGITPDAVRAGEHLRYERSAEDAVAALANNAADIVFLVNPVRMDQLRDTTFAGEVMPQKSTDFYPKMLSGLAMYSLDPKEK